MAPCQNGMILMSQFHKEWPVAVQLNQVTQKIHRYKAQQAKAHCYCPSSCIWTHPAHSNTSHREVSHQINVASIHTVTPTFGICGSKEMLEQVWKPLHPMKKEKVC
ncbi:hypothetical protein AAY473_030399 [Plecturocebus cupreus]